jgi:hypothetical protein
MNNYQHEKWKPTIGCDIKKIPRVWRKPGVHYCVHKSTLLVPTLSHMNPMHTLPSYFVNIHFKINPFKALWFHYVPPALTLENSTFYPHSASGDRIPVRARFSAPVQTGPGAYPAFYTTGTGSFPGVKRPGRGVDHQPHPTLRLRKE